METISSTTNSYIFKRGTNWIRTNAWKFCRLLPYQLGYSTMAVLIFYKFIVDRQLHPLLTLTSQDFHRFCGEYRIWTYDGTNVLFFSVNMREMQSPTLPILLIDIYYGSKLWQPNTVLFLQLISVSAYTVRIIKRVVYLAKLFILTSINLRRVGDSNSHIVSEWLFSRQLLYLLSQPSNCCLTMIRT